MRNTKHIKTIFIAIFSSFVGLSNINSQCNLSELIIETTECDEDNFVELLIDFDFENVGNQGFVVLGNGQNYGNFEYVSLPISIAEIAANCETEYEFIIRDIQDPTCSVFSEFGTICCADACNIKIESISTSECTSDTFSISLVVDTNDEIEDLNVYINNELYDVIPFTANPILIESVIVDQIGESTITICNAINSECCATVTFLNPCDCGMNDITAEIVECSDVDSSYFAIINFEYAATSDSFQMGYSDGGDNNFLGVFAYADLPVLAGPIFWSDNEREILIVDKGDFFCFNTAFMGVVDDCDIECQIFNVFAESYECEDGQYYMDIEFDTEDIEGSTFDVIVDDVNYGSFKYGENFYSVGPINQNCDAAPVLEIQDSNIEFCKDFFNFDEPICCGVLCEFSTFEASSECNDADEVIITFEYENLSITEQNQLFVVLGDQQYGPYAGPSGAEQISIPLLADGIYDIQIYVSGNESCSAITNFEVDCPSIECIISELSVTPQECLDGSFYADIQFESVGTADSFEIRGNGQSYGTFVYGESIYSVGPLLGDCETIYEFSIIDQSDNNCTAVFEFIEPICCSVCEYNELLIALIDCDEDQYTISIDLDYSEDGTSFILNYLGNSAEFDYSELPLEISELPVEMDILITVTSANDPDCTISEISYQESCFDAVENTLISDLKFDQGLASIFVRNASAVTYKYLFTNLNGQEIYHGVLKGNSTEEISTIDLSNGIYLFSIIGEKKVETKKIIVVN